jgi:hypothetical protein
MNMFSIFYCVIFLRFSLLATVLRHHTGMSVSEVRNTVLHFVVWNEPRAVNGCCSSDDGTCFCELGWISDECIRWISPLNHLFSHLKFSCHRRTVTLVLISSHPNTYLRRCLYSAGLPVAIHSVLIPSTTTAGPIGAILLMVIAVVMLE